MTPSGKLFVFEGADGVGKSSLCSAFATAMKRKEVDVKHLSFPGKESGTLGGLVYRLHHDSAQVGVDQLTSASLQALHVAAHLDTLEREILPALEKGRWVILDRFWWSTWVYGIADGVSRELLSALLEVESRFWRGWKPNAVFYITREQPLREEPLEKWEKLKALYEELVGEEEGKYPVQTVQNISTLEDALELILKSPSLAR